MFMLEALRSSIPSVRNISRSPGAIGSDCKWQVGSEIDEAHASFAQAQRWRVAGVDDRRRPAWQIDPNQLSRDVLGVGELLGQPDAGLAGLLGKVNPRAPSIAKPGDQHSGHQGCLDRMAHRVGHREVERVSLQ
jgi:hypothetical protein